MAHKHAISIDHNNVVTNIIVVDTFIPEGYIPFDEPVAIGQTVEDAKRAAVAHTVRTQRDALLVASDWTQLPDAPVDKTAWAQYRQALRDITEQPGFPWNVTWPVKPE